MFQRAGSTLLAWRKLVRIETPAFINRRWSSNTHEPSIIFQATSCRGAHTMEHAEDNVKKQKRTLETEKYEDQIKIWPEEGRHILAHYDEDTVVVYQAFKPSIAKYAVENQKFGGPNYSDTRMTWIKTNFLWMMFRSGWGSKKDQERTLAIWLKRSSFEWILSQAVGSKFHPEVHGTKENYDKLKKGKVRLQWDPDHKPDGSKTTRRAIQLGLKGLKEFTNGDVIVKIEDISDFVDEQSIKANTGAWNELIVPRERVYQLNDEKIAKTINLNGADISADNDDNAEEEK